MKQPKPRNNRAHRRRSMRVWHTVMEANKGYLRRAVSEPSIIRSMFSITQVTEVDAQFPGSYTYVS